MTAAGRTLLAEVHSGRGYQSHYGLTLHFGLAAGDHVNRVEIRWLGGSTEVLEHLPADLVLTVVERDLTQFPAQPCLPIQPSLGYNGCSRHVVGLSGPTMSVIPPPRRTK
jgi:hypothetical protein